MTENKPRDILSSNEDTALFEKLGQAVNRPVPTDFAHRATVRFQRALHTRFLRLTTGSVAAALLLAAPMLWIGISNITYVSTTIALAIGKLITLTSTFISLVTWLPDVRLALVSSSVVLLMLSAGMLALVARKTDTLKYVSQPTRTLIERR
jgi:hypothetical protein